jgi:serpin B
MKKLLATLFAFASPLAIAADPAADRINAFGFDLYGKVRSQPGNLLVSPLSVSQALTMTYAGAAGETQKQMAAVLRLDMAAKDTHADFAKLAEALHKQVRQATESGAKLRIANALWPQAGFELLPDFVATLKSHYGAAPRQLDYSKPADAAEVINRWVAEQTENLIQNLIPADALNSDTRLVLTNAVYFLGQWQHPFTKAATKDGEFTLLDGSKLQTPMMRQRESFRYYESSGTKAIELPYREIPMSMVIVLPAAGKLSEVEQSLAADGARSVLDELKGREVELVMPKFKFDAAFDLNGALQAMGMVDAFAAGTANFARIHPTQRLFISKVVHKAFVRVDEVGTEAAAATGMVMRATAMPSSDPVKMTIDRPFVFLIRDTSSGANLFVGRVVDPRQE